MNICIIPARGGSRRIPWKNIKIFHGKPIIAYSIECAKASGIFDHIVVSTDSIEIAKIANGYGVLVHGRSADTARDEVGTQEVMHRVLYDLLSSGYDLEGGYACCLYATAPMLCPETLVRAAELFDADRMGYFVPVGTWLRDPGQFYFGSVWAFKNKIPLLSDLTVMLPIDPATDCDINTQEDWDRALKMYEQLHHGEK